MKLYKLSLIFIVYCFLTAPHSFAQTTKPNVIIIKTDDMGNNLGNLGNPWLKTPNIDKLSEESVLLTNLYLQTTPYGRVAQLVQSTWFTPKGSGVRIPSRPQ